MKGGETILTEPLSVTYNGSAKSLARTSQSANRTVYKTGDLEFEMVISDIKMPRKGEIGRSITLARYLPDPTPADAFDAYREVRNSFGFSYVFAETRAETSVDIPRLRAALIAYCDSTLQSRIIAGEK
jgi:hypothetical protein